MYGECVLSAEREGDTGWCPLAALWPHETRAHYNGEARREGGDTEEMYVYNTRIHM